jgi:hypothetical protein
MEAAVRRAFGIADKFMVNSVDLPKFAVERLTMSRLKMLADRQAQRQGLERQAVKAKEAGRLGG